MNRRGFLGAVLALGAAPAIVRADSLMKVVPRGLEVLTYAERPIIIHRGNVMAHETLVRWWAEKMDQIVYNALVTGPYNATLSIPDGSLVQRLEEQPYPSVCAR